MLSRDVWWKTLLCCIMGSVGSSIYGVWPIPGTKSQEKSAPAAIFAILLFFFFYFVMNQDVE